MSQGQAGAKASRSRSRKMIGLKIYVTEEIKNALDEVVKKFKLKSRSELIRSIFALFLFNDNRPGTPGFPDWWGLRAPAPSRGPGGEAGRVGYGDAHKEIMNQLRKALAERAKKTKRKGGDEK